MDKNLNYKNFNISVIGLGYVGLPLAVALAKKFKVIGYDKKEIRVNELRRGYDNTGEVAKEKLLSLSRIEFTSNAKDIKDSNVFIISVPTPINTLKKPDLSYLISASKQVGKVLKKGDLVIYESTAYPGLTEEECIPILERTSGLVINNDFSCGYSPERINPGDSTHSIENITKVISASNQLALLKLDLIYGSIIKAGTYLAESIRVAEAAKVIENTQRDLNIALINELSILFNRMGIDTNSVLEAASTKWNFLKFEPGLVGGHCIGVDPYYLTYKAKQVGFDPKIILSGRSVNDQMPRFIIDELKSNLEQKKVNISTSRLLICGYTFKENCNDYRNTKVFDIAKIASKKFKYVEIFDPLLNHEELTNETSLKFIENISETKKYNAVILAVPHKDLVSKGFKFYNSILTKKGVFFDLKSSFAKQHSDFRL